MTLLSNLQPSDSEVFDILIALRKLPVTIELLRETRIGNSVNDAKKKFAVGSKSFIESKDIIALWKKSCDITKSNSEADVNTEGATKKKMPVNKVTAPVEEENEDNEDEKNYDKLSQTRRKVGKLQF